MAEDARAELGRSKRIVDAYENSAEPNSVAELLDMGTLDRFVNPGSAALRNLVEGSGKLVLDRLPIDDQNMLDPLNQDDIDWADDRSSELVDPKWVDPTAR